MRANADNLPADHPLRAVAQLVDDNLDPSADDLFGQLRYITMLCRVWYEHTGQNLAFSGVNADAYVFMIARADADGLPVDHPLRIVAQEYNDAYSTKTITQDHQRHLHQCWYDYTGEILCQEYRK